MHLNMASGVFCHQNLFCLQIYLEADKMNLEKELSTSHYVIKF